METEVDKYSITDLIRHSIEKQPVDFENAFSSLIGDRLAAAVENKKVEVAQSMFASPVEQEVDVDQQTEVDTEEEQNGETA